MFERRILTKNSDGRHVWRMTSSIMYDVWRHVWRLDKSVILVSSCVYFCKILRLLFWLRYRFSDVLRNCKLCKLQPRYPIPRYPITVMTILYVCCSRVAVATSHNKPYLVIWVLVWIPDRSRYNNTNNQQSDTLFRLKIRFSDALLVSQKYTKTKKALMYL